MMSLNCRYLCTHVIEKGERVNMSNWNEMYSDDEEQMVA